MASLRRNTAIGTDGASPRFLYAIIKQLDLRSVDWNEVASQLGITNGHAARMRYSRFKQQMEGIPPAPRKPRSAVVQRTPAKKTSKPESKSNIRQEERLKREDTGETKEEPWQPILGLYEKVPAERSLQIKGEPLENIDPGYVEDKRWMSLEPHNYPENNLIDPQLEDIVPTSTEVFQAIKEEPGVKAEPMWN